MSDEPEPTTQLDYLRRISRDIRVIRDLVSKATSAMVEAETEIAEKMRRFVMYMHDVHDICNIYEERGHQPPEWVRREMERCDDRYRQLLTEAHTDGGTFEKIRREMAADPENRWDHTRLLPKRSAE